MYIGLGQEEVLQPKKESTKDILVGIAALIDPLAQATSATVEIQMRNEINIARVKAGLPPLLPPGAILVPPPLPKEEGISTSSLLLGLMVVGGVLYFLSLKKKEE